MAKHMWVELKMTPLEVEPQLDGSIHVFATDAAMEIATEDARNACWFCYTPLEPETFDTECTVENKPLRTE